MGERSEEAEKGQTWQGQNLRKGVIKEEKKPEFDKRRTKSYNEHMTINGQKEGMWERYKRWSKGRVVVMSHQQDLSLWGLGCCGGGSVTHAERHTHTEGYKPSCWLCLLLLQRQLETIQGYDWDTQFTHIQTTLSLDTHKQSLFKNLRMKTGIEDYILSIRGKTSCRISLASLYLSLFIFHEVVCMQKQML